MFRKLIVRSSITSFMEYLQNRGGITTAISQHDINMSSRSHRFEFQKWRRKQKNISVSTLTLILPKWKTPWTPIAPDTLSGGRNETRIICLARILIADYEEKEIYPLALRHVLCMLPKTQRMARRSTLNIHTSVHFSMRSLLNMMALCRPGIPTRNPPVRTDVIRITWLFLRFWIIFQPSSCVCVGVHLTHAALQLLRFLVYLPTPTIRPDTLRDSNTWQTKTYQDRKSVV